MMDQPERIGPYEIQGRLGAGGMGVVYKGRHQETGQGVAIKTVRVLHSRLLQSIRREIRALARLQHPGVVGIVAEGVEDGIPWYAMELLDAVTLRELQGESLASSSKIPSWHLGLGVLQQLCVPLAYIHGEGVVHRDLKPSNILVRADGRPVLVDFGVTASFGGAEGRETLTLEASGPGALSFLAPEQIRGDLPDARADLYALGCILYWVLVGRPPFRGRTPRETIRAHLYQHPPLPSEQVPDLPRELDDLVLHLLAKEPSMRVGHAADVALHLERLGIHQNGFPEAPPPRSYFYRPALAGRQKVLESLTHALSEAVAGRGSGKLLAGESGIGKTRLVMELIQAAGRQGVRLLTGEGAPDSGGIPLPQASVRPPLSLWRRFLQAAADRCREKGPKETQRLLGDRGSFLSLYEPALADLPGFKPHETFEEEQSLPPTAARLRLFSFLEEVLSAFIGDEPTLLVCDDLGWADDLSLGFLEFLLRADWFQRRRVLFLGLYRSDEPGEHLASLKELIAERIELHGLRENDVSAMVEDMLALPFPNAEFIAFLTRCSKGNPLFVAEYLKSALLEGVLCRDPESGRWRLTGEKETAGDSGASMRHPSFRDLPVPQTLQEMLAQRMKGLASEALQLVARIAVVGREAPVSLVKELLPVTERDWVEAIDLLLARQILEEPHSGSLRFRHEWLHHHALNSIDPTTRQGLHRRIAEILVSAPGLDRQKHLVSVAQHWHAAGEIQHAVDAYLKAARLAKRRYALAEAEKLYMTTLALLPEPSSLRNEIRNEVARAVLLIQGRAGEAAKELHTALEDARALGLERSQADCLLGLAKACRDSGRRSPAQASAEAAFEIYRKLGDRDAEGAALAELGIICMEDGRYDQSLFFHQKALQLHKTAENRTAEIDTVNRMGRIYREQGRLRKARALFEEAFSSAQRLDDRRYEAIALSNLASIAWQDGQLDDSLVMLGQVLEIFEQMEDRQNQALNLLYLARVQADRGLLSLARGLAGDAVAIAHRIGQPCLEADALLHLGLLQIDAGLVLEARDSSLRALAIWRQMRDEVAAAGALRVLARVERRVKGDLERARQLLDLALQSWERAGKTLMSVEGLCELGHLALARGDSGGAWLDKARELARACHVSPRGHYGKALERLENAVRCWESGERLQGGEAPWDLPKAWKEGEESTKLTEEIDLSG